MPNPFKGLEKNIFQDDECLSPKSKAIDPDRLTFVRRLVYGCKRKMHLLKMTSNKRMILSLKRWQGRSIGGLLRLRLKVTTDARHIASKQSECQITRLLPELLHAIKLPCS